MREFTPNQNVEIPVSDISELMEKHFGELQQGVREFNQKNWAKFVAEPDTPLIEEVIAIAEYDGQNHNVTSLHLSFMNGHLPSQFHEDDLETIEELIHEKNDFLETVTGKTAEERREEILDEVVDGEEVQPIEV